MYVRTCSISIQKSYIYVYTYVDDDDDDGWRVDSWQNAFLSAKKIMTMIVLLIE